MRKFLKKDQVKLENGGWLLASETSSPVFNAAFVNAQNEAHYIVELSKSVKGADFKGKEAANFETIKEQVAKRLNDDKVVYVTKSDNVATPTVDALKNEALAWLTNQDSNKKSDKINSLMSAFDVIHEFESFGLFFEEDTVKLKNIYSIEEILKAVTILEPFLKA